MVKDVGLRGLASVPAADSVDSTVALIQGLIPLGLTAAAEALKAEVVALAGERYSRPGGLRAAELPRGEGCPLHRETTTVARNQEHVA